MLSKHSETCYGNVTVVICTRYPSAHLEKCVEAVLSQTLPIDRYKILIAFYGNNSDKNPYAEKKSHLDKIITYLQLPQTGFSDTLEACLAHIDTKWTACIADDAIAESDWLYKLLKSFASDDNIRVAGGELLPLWGSERPNWLTDHWLRSYSVNLAWSDKSRLLDDSEWLCCGNICFDTGVLEKSRLFSAHFGCRDNWLPCNERFFNEMVGCHNKRLFFDPNIKVQRYIRAEQLTPHWLTKQLFWQGAADATRSQGKTPETGQSGGDWIDMRLPVSHWDWASFLNLYTDSELDKNFERSWSLGYMLQKADLVQP